MKIRLLIYFVTKKPDTACRSTSAAVWRNSFHQMIFSIVYLESFINRERLLLKAGSIWIHHDD